MNTEIQIHHDRNSDGPIVYFRKGFNDPKPRVYRNISFWSGRRLERLANGRNVLFRFSPPEIQNVSSRFYFGGFFTGIFITHCKD